MKNIKNMIAAVLIVGTISGFSVNTVHAVEDKKVMLGTVNSEIEAVSLIEQESRTTIEVNLNEIEGINRDKEVYRIRAEYLRDNIEVTDKKMEMLEKTKPANFLQAAMLSLSKGYVEMELADILAVVHSSIEKFEAYEETFISPEDRITIEKGLIEKKNKLNTDLLIVETLISSLQQEKSVIEAINNELNGKIGEVHVQVQTLSVQKTQLETEIRAEEERIRLEQERIRIEQERVKAEQERLRQIELEKQRSSTFIRPSAGRLTSGFGNRIHPVTRKRSFHEGIDLANPAGTRINASRNGTVTFAGNKGAYGRMIVIKHANGVETAYAHLSSIGVRVGQKVTQGQQIGKMGSTGRSTGSHLHFEIRINGKAVNPLNYFK
ncbi:MAG TPA: peptidoglycan DD-metalloendopeptidase family protein [Bacteroidales bacterium]|nr:peptidoglycan DD-metalloendopeptidase family protein [Bacteroidales bacterium]